MINIIFHILFVSKTTVVLVVGRYNLSTSIPCLLTSVTKGVPSVKFFTQYYFLLYK
jgi:hypothetical protein